MTRRRVLEALTRWRLWVGVLVPSCVSFGLAYWVPNGFLAAALILSFHVIVAKPFVTRMARADAYAKLEFVRERAANARRVFAELREAAETLPPDMRERELREIDNDERKLAELERMIRDMDAKR